LKDEFSSQNQIVFGRDSRAEALKHLSLRPGADFTKATLIRLGESVDADYVYYGTYDASLPSGSSALKDSSIHVSAHVINLRKLHDGPDLAEAGKLLDLTRLEEHLAWQSLHYLDPSFSLPLEQFLVPGKIRRADAEESYIRGLLSSDKDQQQKWFMQAFALDSHFVNPAYELGKLALEHKEFRQALGWFQRIPAANPRYPEVRFKMGLAAYGAGDYGASASYFREIVKNFPLSEVYNDLGAAENRLDQLSAADDFRHALESDPNDPVYLFNLGNTLLKHGNFDDAEQRFQMLLKHNPNDAEARTLLGEAQRHETVGGSTGKPLAPDRLKSNFDFAAFRQLKAVVQGKSTP
jgi:tetratricopeptide (TPR) repeat protein